MGHAAFERILDEIRAKEEALEQKRQEAEAAKLKALEDEKAGVSKLDSVNTSSAPEEDEDNELDLMMLRRFVDKLVFRKIMKLAYTMLKDARQRMQNEAFGL